MKKYVGGTDVENLKHILTLENRKKLVVTGVKGVDSMSDREIEIVLDSARIAVKGRGLVVSRLNSEDGNLTVNGDDIFSVYYGDAVKSKTSFAKIFK